MAKTTGAVDARAKSLIEQGDTLFNKRSTLMSLWQHIAENFYPERADFTTCRTLGEDFAAGLYSSWPIICRRELGNSFSSMMRRRDQEWFRVAVDREEYLDNAGRQWLDMATGIQRRAMYDLDAQFTRATKEGDQDYASFGQCVLSIEVNWKKTALLYRCWHLRDFVWREGADGAICDRHLNYKETAYNLREQFGEDALHPKMRECFNRNRDPHREFSLRRIIIPADRYDKPRRVGGPEWVSIIIDLDNQHIINERFSRTPVFVIPRWQTVSGSQYSFSPAVTAGLPDARLLQSMSLTLLEAGEQAVRPPMIAVGEAITGGVQLYAGGVTNIDAAYDERMGEALRPAFDTKGGIPYGMEMAADREQKLLRAFYIDKLRQMPAKEMTATEAQRWAEDWIREAIPLFEPMEDEYNGRVCMQTFEELMAVNAFGPVAGPMSMLPRSLAGADIRFKFKSPLSDAIERQRGRKFFEAKQFIAEAVSLDPACTSIIDARTALRDALHGNGTPARWLRSEEQVEQYAQQLTAQQQQQREADEANLGADTAQKAGKAVESFARVA